MDVGASVQIDCGLVRHFKMADQPMISLFADAKPSTIYKIIYRCMHIVSRATCRKMLLFTEGRLSRNLTAMVP